MNLLQRLSLLAAALVCTAARAYQLFFCYDAQGLPVSPAGILCLAPLVCFVLFWLLSRGMTDSGERFDERFRFDSTLPLFLGVMGAFALVAAAVLPVIGGGSLTDLVSAAFLAVSGGCIFFVLVCLRKDKPFPPITAAFPAAYLSVQLVLTYRDCAKDPVMINFYVELLALAALAWAFVELGALAFRSGSVRSFLPVAMISAVLCIAGAATAPTLFWLLLLGGFALVQLAFLAALQ